MQKILTLNQISVKGLDRFPRDAFEVGTEIRDPNAILVRSHPLDAEHITASLRAVARAGAARIGHLLFGTRPIRHGPTAISAQ